MLQQLYHSVQLKMIGKYLFSEEHIVKMYHSVQLKMIGK